MNPTVWCRLVKGGRIVDPVGFTTTVDPADPHGSDEWLRDRLRREIRYAGADPVADAAAFSLLVSRLDEPADAPMVTVRLVDDEKEPA